MPGIAGVPPASKKTKKATLKKRTERSRRSARLLHFQHISHFNKFSLKVAAFNDSGICLLKLRCIRYAKFRRGKFEQTDNFAIAVLSHGARIHLCAHGSG
jgi:aspartyl/asparaginyl beta-hydroxylase (cupin superfamily)